MRLKPYSSKKAAGMRERDRLGMTIRVSRKAKRGVIDQGVDMNNWFAIIG